jgi:hypothetical protein
LDLYLKRFLDNYCLALIGVEDKDRMMIGCVFRFGHISRVRAILVNSLNLDDN